jgi:mono/diheme cytochrome c family protein
MHLNADSSRSLQPVYRWPVNLVCIAFACFVGWLPTGDAFAESDHPVDFQREVRPILASKCFTCHGPDDAARQADLRLDEATDAFDDRGDYQAIKPGDHRESEVWKRLVTDDADLRMPPADGHEPLSPSQIETLARWIDQGAKYETHWAFVPPTKPPVPTVPDAATPIDAFINRALIDAGLDPSPPADPYAIVRRVYLDLIGIPPTPAEADAFVADPTPLAYSRLVDSLIARPEYAERWARPWLDLARYADTNGYEKDRPRTIWPYRDWVLNAIASDMPFDQFTIRQLAGDMIPGATDEDRIATGFHRNTMLNEEGGIDPQEYRFHAMVDRVGTTGTVWMGLTVGCAQCHTHKYDPITHTDYYAMFALLNAADEPEHEVADPEVTSRREAIAAQIRQMEDRLIEEHLTAASDSAAGSETTTEIQKAFEEFVANNRTVARDWQVVVPSAMESTMPTLTVQDDGSILASGDVTKREVYRLTFPPLQDASSFTAIRLEALPDESLPAGGPGMAFYEGRRGDFFLSELTLSAGDNVLKLEKPSTSFGKISIGSGSADAGNVIDGEGSTGWSTSGAEGEANRWVANFEKPFSPDAPWTIEMVFERHFAAALGRFRISLASGDEATALKFDAATEAELVKWQSDPQATAGPSLVDSLQRRFLYDSDLLKEHRKAIESLRTKMPEPVRTLVMRERPEGNERLTRRYHRGEYLHPREEVAPAVPAIFANSDGPMPTNRYEFAKWLVSDANPMFARVTVDRAWRDLFGRGIVHTAGDYGTQSEPPSHPELLDYLATRFVSDGMSMKRLHREIVMSDAYRRSSHRRPEVFAIDPQNKLLAIGPRRRLEGERIRDAILSSSDLLAHRMGGPSVYPPQPAGVTARAYGNVKWNESKGADRYRRSVYTYAKRTAPFAALGVFDGPTGETCLPRRETSNSPLQALTLMNDAMFIEMAQALADDVARQVDPNDRPAMASALFRRLITRPPTQNEVTAIVDFHQSIDADDASRWMLVARALMNLDEVITTP